MIIDRVGMHRELVGATSDGLPTVVGLTAVVFSVLYFVSDLMELAQGGFSTVQLALTYVAEAAIPLFVIGLYAVQRPRIGLLGFAGAVGYAYSFVFFTGAVLVAVVDGIPNWDALVDQMGMWVTVRGALMVLAGLAFGLAVVRANVLPRWTGVALMAGVVMIAGSTDLPAIGGTADAGVRDLAFASMGVALLVAAHGPPVRRSSCRRFSLIPARHRPSV